MSDLLTTSFDPSDRIIVSYSEIDAFRQCPFKWLLAYGPEGRWSKPPKSMSPLSKGTDFHTMKEFWYNLLMTGKLDAKAFDAWLDSIEPDQRKLIQWMHEGYKDHYGEDSDWEILAVESKTIVPLFYADGTESPFALKVKIDLLVKSRRSGLLVLVDHKSGSRAPSRASLEFEEQFGLYEFALNRLWAMEGRSERIFATCHNYASTNMNQGDIFKPGDEGYKKSMRETPLEKRFKREYIPRPKAELQRIERETLMTLDEMYPYIGGEGWNIDNTPRHPNRDTCQRRCDFTDVCLTGRRANDNNRTLQAMEMSGFVKYVPENRRTTR